MKLELLDKVLISVPLLLLIGVVGAIVWQGICHGQTFRTPPPPPPH